MALPPFGVPLSLADINGEFGRGTNLNAYRGTDYYTSSGGPFIFPATPISINNFYSTQANNPYSPALRVDVLTASSSSFTVPAGTPFGTVYTYAIVGGGGGSRGNPATLSSVTSGGGGGGQVITGTFSVFEGQVITFTVGAGGTTSTSVSPYYTDGLPTTIQTVSLNGGTTVTAAGGTGSFGGAGTSGSGNLGGTGSGTAAVNYKGGGGGQGAVGYNSTDPTFPSVGGAGITITVGGVSYSWGGGGGGGRNSGSTVGPAIAGGLGGGGLGATCTTNSADPLWPYGASNTAGTNGTGGGAGGAAKATSGPGSGSFNVTGRAGGTGHIIIYG